MKDYNNICLVTGGLGFIGRNLTNALIKQGYYVIILDNLSPQIHGALPQFDEEFINHPGIEIVRADITNRQVVAEAVSTVNCIVHLAAETGTAQSMYEMSKYNYVNTYGTAVLLEEVLKSDNRVDKIVLASSRAVYGEGAYSCAEHGTVYPGGRSSASLKKHLWDLNCPVCSSLLSLIATSEECKTNSVSIYAATKLAQEELVQVAGDAMNIGFTILRFQNVYGEGQSLLNPYTGILSIFSSLIRQHKTINVYEDGRESRDFVHVDDAVQSIILSLTDDKANGQTYNVGSGQPTSVLTLVELLSDLFNYTQPYLISGDFRMGDIRHCYADLRRISNDLGFSPQISLQQGLERFVKWVKTQPIAKDQLGKATAELKKYNLTA